MNDTHALFSSVEFFFSVSVTNRLLHIEAESNALTRSCITGRPYDAYSCWHSFLGVAHSGCSQLTHGGTDCDM